MNDTLIHCDVCNTPIPRKNNPKKSALCHLHSGAVRQIMKWHNVTRSMAVKALKLGLQFPTKRTFQNEIKKFILTFALNHRERLYELENI